MKSLSVKVCGHTYPAKLIAHEYARGGLALELVDTRDGQLIATVSIWLDLTPLLPDGVAWCKHWSENDGILSQLVAQGVLEPTPLPPTSSGFVQDIRAYRYHADGLADRDTQDAARRALTPSHR